MKQHRVKNYLWLLMILAAVSISLLSGCSSTAKVQAKKPQYCHTSQTIKTQNGGDGDFYVIETERWAFDNIPELINILKRFQTKHSLIKSKELE